MTDGLKGEIKLNCFKKCQGSISELSDYAKRVLLAQMKVKPSEFELWSSEDNNAIVGLLEISDAIEHGLSLTALTALQNRLVASDR